MAAGTKEGNISNKDFCGTPIQLDVQLYNNASVGRLQDVQTLLRQGVRPDAFRNFVRPNQA